MVQRLLDRLNSIKGKVNAMMERKLEDLEKRFYEIEQLISQPEVVNRVDEYRDYLKEHSFLSPIIQKYSELKRVIKEMLSLEELAKCDDVELKIMAASEKEQLKNSRKDIEEEIKLMLLPPDPNLGKNIIIEIRAGTGGEEAALFAGELFKMYCRYSENNKWKVEVIDSHTTGLGGYKEVSFMVAGKTAWSRFRFEQGIHRVQRVPLTEASGRVHTSAVTVAVLPEAEEIEIEVRTEDLKIDTYRASGAGGQHINKTDSAIRITHIPTGIVVACQEERSQIKNRATAMKVLRAKLLEQKQREQTDSIDSTRKQQIGSGDRSEKIRTYNYPQNRITDHRIDLSLYRLKDVLEGDLEELVEKLRASDQEKMLLVFNKE